MEAVRTSETFAYFNEITMRNIPEGYHLHNRRRENLKFHKFYIVYTHKRNVTMTMKMQEHDSGPLEITAQRRPGLVPRLLQE
jgi:hypothetical protein